VACCLIEFSGQERTMALKAVVCAILVTGSSGARRHRRAAATSSDESARGVKKVDKLYTYGAPCVSPTELRNPASSDGCFPGIRFINQQPFLTDSVPSLLTFGWDHPFMTKVRLDDKNVARSTPCGEYGLVQTRAPSVSLHAADVYKDRSVPMGGEVKDVAMVGLMNSYEEASSTVDSNLRSYGGGWSRAGTAKNGLGDVSHLMKKRDGTCILTFEGSENPLQDWEDWAHNLQAVPVSYCGLGQSVHKGFRDELRKVVNSTQWQSNIRSKLSSCSKVIVTGHSLGGAVASLFTACANTGGSSADYNWISF
jgi:hypothetical protein